MHFYIYENTSDTGQVTLLSDVPLTGNGWEKLKKWLIEQWKMVQSLSGAEIEGLGFSHSGPNDQKMLIINTKDEHAREQLITVLKSQKDFKPKKQEELRAFRDELQDAEVVNELKKTMESLKNQKEILLRCIVKSDGIQKHHEKLPQGLKKIGGASDELAGISNEFTGQLQLVDQKIQKLEDMLRKYEEAAADKQRVVSANKKEDRQSKKGQVNQAGIDPEHVEKDQAKVQLIEQIKRLEKRLAEAEEKNEQAKQEGRANLERLKERIKEEVIRQAEAHATEVLQKNVGKQPAIIHELSFTPKFDAAVKICPDGTMEEFRKVYDESRTARITKLIMNLKKVQSKHREKIREKKQAKEQANEFVSGLMRVIDETLEKKNKGRKNNTYDQISGKKAKEELLAFLKINIKSENEFKTFIGDTGSLQRAKSQQAKRFAIFNSHPDDNESALGLCFSREESKGIRSAFDLMNNYSTGSHSSTSGVEKIAAFVRGCGDIIFNQEYLLQAVNDEMIRKNVIKEIEDLQLLLIVNEDETNLELKNELKESLRFHGYGHNGSLKKLVAKKLVEMCFNEWSSQELIDFFEDNCLEEETKEDAKKSPRELSVEYPSILEKTEVMFQAVVEYLLGRDIDASRERPVQLLQDISRQYPDAFEIESRSVVCATSPYELMSAEYGFEMATPDAECIRSVDIYRGDKVFEPPFEIDKAGSSYIDQDKKPRVHFDLHESGGDDEAGAGVEVQTIAPEGQEEGKVTVYTFAKKIKSKLGKLQKDYFEDIYPQKDIASGENFNDQIKGMNRKELIEKLAEDIHESNFYAMMVAEFLEPYGRIRVNGDTRDFPTSTCLKFFQDNPELQKEISSQFFEKIKSFHESPAVYGPAVRMPEIENDRIMQHQQGRVDTFIKGIFDIIESEYKKKELQESDKLLKVQLIMAEFLMAESPLENKNRIIKGLQDRSWLQGEMDEGFMFPAKGLVGFLNSYGLLKIKQHVDGQAKILTSQKTDDTIFEFKSGTAVTAEQVRKSAKASLISILSAVISNLSGSDGSTMFLQENRGTCLAIGDMIFGSNVAPQSGSLGQKKNSQEWIRTFCLKIAQGIINPELKRFLDSTKLEKLMQEFFVRYVISKVRSLNLSLLNQREIFDSLVPGQGAASHDGLSNQNISSLQTCLKHFFDNCNDENFSNVFHFCFSGDENQRQLVLAMGYACQDYQKNKRSEELLQTFNDWGIKDKLEWALGNTGEKYQLYATTSSCQIEGFELIEDPDMDGALFSNLVQSIKDSTLVSIVDEGFNNLNSYIDVLLTKYLGAPGSEKTNDPNVQCIKSYLIAFHGYDNTAAFELRIATLFRCQDKISELASAIEVHVTWQLANYYYNKMTLYQKLSLFSFDETCRPIKIGEFVADVLIDRMESPLDVNKKSMLVTKLSVEMMALFQTKSDGIKAEKIWELQIPHKASEGSSKGAIVDTKTFLIHIHERIQAHLSPFVSDGSASMSLDTNVVPCTLNDTLLESACEFLNQTERSAPTVGQSPFEVYHTPESYEKYNELFRSLFSSDMAGFTIYLDGKTEDECDAIFKDVNQAIKNSVFKKILAILEAHPDDGLDKKLNCGFYRADKISEDQMTVRQEFNELLERLKNGNSQQSHKAHGFFSHSAFSVTSTVESSLVESSLLADTIVKLIRQENSNLLPECITMQVLTYILTQSNGHQNATLIERITSSTRINALAKTFSSGNFLSQSGNTESNKSPNSPP